MDRDMFIIVFIAMSLLVIVVWAFAIELKKTKAANENLKKINDEIREDVLGLLGLANVIFLSSDIKMKKQSTLARVFFNNNDLKKYEWDSRYEDYDSFWDKETIDKFELNEDTEDEYFAIQERIEFLKNNFYRKIQDMNEKYDSWNSQDTFEEIVSDQGLELFKKKFDKITS